MTPFTRARSGVTTVSMIRRAVIASLLLLAACSGKDEGGKTKAPTTEDALKTASSPFTIGNVTDGEMGAAPPGELDDGTADPYARMARDENTAAPQTAGAATETDR